MTQPFAGAMRGPMSGRGIIGDVTEAMQRFLLDGYDIAEQPPRIEEDVKFVPKDSEEVVYVYMYRVAHNPNLQNRKRYRQAPVFVGAGPEDGGEVYYHRPPLLLDVYYLVMVHSKFRSDAERLLGWVLLRLNEATHLIYRPRKFKLPDGREVDSMGRPYDPDCDTEPDELWVEKVALSLVDDLTVGDAINLFSLHEAPYRPFLTYRARVAMDGPLVQSMGGTTVEMPRLEAARPPGAPSNTSPSGRMRQGGNSQRSSEPRKPPGPEAHFLRRNAVDDPDLED